MLFQILLLDTVFDILFTKYFLRL